MNHRKNPSMAPEASNGLSSLPYGNILKKISNPTISPAKHKQAKSFSSSYHSDFRSFLSNTSSHVLENSKMHEVLKPYHNKSQTMSRPLSGNKTQIPIQPKTQISKERTSLLEKRRDIKSTYHNFFSAGFSLFNNKTVSKNVDSKDRTSETGERPSMTPRLSTSADSPNIFQQKLTDRAPSAPFSTDRVLISTKRENSKTGILSHRSANDQSRSSPNQVKYVYKYEKFQ
jgi:hypothetical protein